MIWELYSACVFCQKMPSRCLQVGWVLKKGTYQFIFSVSYLCRVIFLFFSIPASPALGVKVGAAAYPSCLRV